MWQLDEATSYHGDSFKGKVCLSVPNLYLTHFFTFLTKNQTNLFLRFTNFAYRRSTHKYLLSANSYITLFN